MEKVMQQKLFKMLHSNDSEIANLGLETLKGAVTTWQEYKALRGLSIGGVAFFPYKLRAKVKKFGTELRIKRRMSSKRKLRKAYFEYENRLGSNKIDAIQ